MELRVNDYVRTKTGIHKIFRINEKADIWKYHCDKKPTGEWDSSYEYIKVRKDDIIKSSPNIIDLIEEDDFINGMRITQIISNKNGVLECMKDSDYEFITTITNNEVESVLTHEQFESMKYRIGE